MRDAKKNSAENDLNGELSLEALASESGLTERTIRYYISRGLIDGPARGGRGAFYTSEHLKRLREIQRNQQQGLTLTEIERLGETASAPGRLPQPETWYAYPLADDIVVHVKAGSNPWRQHQVKSTLERLARELSPRDAAPRKEREQ
jgi:DNA-binding transcriptional MerR regulator